MDQLKNITAAKNAQDIYKQTGKNLIRNLNGGNGAQQIVTTVSDANYLFPSNCKFYSKDVSNISQYLTDEKYDFILLDPPWWNKFVRRRKKTTKNGYEMMYCEDLSSIPIDNLLADDGLIAVWCSNNQQYMNHLLNNVFLQWNVHFVAKLFWVKV